LASRGLAIVVALLIAGCAGIPKVELTAYATAYAETQTITNGVLDIVAPYERMVIRYAAKSIKTARPEPAVLSPGVDPSLLANPAAAKATRSETRIVVAERPCRGGYTGPDPFCYEMRDAYADIGDPALVAAYRNLSNVVARFNALLLAYADGVSGKLIKQELDGLSSSIAATLKVPPLTNVTGAATFAAGFTGLVGKLVPVAELVGGVVDRTQLREFLLVNYVLVDQAIELMATNSPALYANVAVGTQLFRIQARGAGDALNTRRKDIRRLIANWTVLLDDSRRLFSELKHAIEDPDGLETRLRNLNESTVVARIDTSAMKKQIATLGTPVPLP
jgi:hypothetical protein